MVQMEVDRSGDWGICAVALVLCCNLASCGSGGGGAGGGGGGKNQTPPASGLTATAGNGQVSLSWSPYSGATAYGIERSTTNSGDFPYLVMDPLYPPLTTTSYTDVGLANGTTYYYKVVADGSWGVSNPSDVASATPSGPATSVTVTVDPLSNIHTISSSIYGGAFPNNAGTITGASSIVRWGGNGSSTYNWKFDSYNAVTDQYFEDLMFCGFGGGASNAPCADSDSTQWVKDVIATGSTPLLTMPMLPWAAQPPENSSDGHWSFSVSRDGPQCHTDPQNPDAGDGIALSSACDTQPSYLTAGANDITNAYLPLLDDHSQTCPVSYCIYRDDWINAIATAWGGGNINWEMDNEMDLWGTTHRDVHPTPSGYDEMASTFMTETAKLRATDPHAIIWGPVSCCWWYYWNGANPTDKAAHAGIDFLPWWLNQIYWQDQVAGTTSLNIFDVHAFPDASTTDGNGNPLTQSQLRALSTSIFRDFWDPTFVSPSPTINQLNVTSIQPYPSIPFRIPRLKALANTIYPGTLLGITAWSAAFAGESDFSTALADADAYGIMGRENVGAAARWKSPNPANPNYLVLMLYRNYEGLPGASHYNFGFTSVAATHNADPNLFSVYATASGDGMELMIVNKDPQREAQVQFNLSNFNPTKFMSYTLISTSPAAIVTSGSTSWASTQYFPPYSVTLVVIYGSFGAQPTSYWSLNPDAIMIPAGGTATLNPEVTAGASGIGNAHATLSAAVFDAYEGVPACNGNMTITNPVMMYMQNASITVNAGNTPGFCHFTVTGNDGSATQTEGGWIIVGNPAASLTIAGGNNQTGMHSTALPIPLSVNLAPGGSGGMNPASGASIFFSTNAGTLSNGTSSGPKVMATTNGSGAASVTLTLPATAQSVTVTVEGPYALGHPTVAFTETAQ